MKNTELNFEIIEKFLQGNNPKKYVVAIESSYRDDFVSLIINDPNTGKRIENHKYTPFLWMKHDVSNILYEGNRVKIKSAARDCRVKIKEVQTANSDGYVPERLQNGYKYLVTCDGSFGKLLNFFRLGGIDIYSDEHKDLFVVFTPVEQFMMQSGIRLFKGFEDYTDLHKIQFDLETEGLEPKTDAIFQIGIKDNRGFEIV